MPFESAALSWAEYMAVIRASLVRMPGLTAYRHACIWSTPAEQASPDFKSRDELEAFLAIATPHAAKYAEKLWNSYKRALHAIDVHRAGWDGHA
ncbi:MAG: hypothetical protein ACREGR_02625 [Minisyncoccia bacterium]